MKIKNVLARIGGLATAAVTLLSQSAGLTGGAAQMTGRNITDTCTYAEDVSIKLQRGEATVVKPGDYGVKPTDVITEVWIDLSTDISSGKPIMPAMGYDAPGYENAEMKQKDWYGTGDWIQTPAEKMTFSWEALKDFPITSSFQLQLWGEEGAVIETATVTRLGFKVKGGGSIGTATRPGDVNNDRMVSVADAVTLVKFLLCETETLPAPANADMDKNNTLNAVDLALLKRGLLNGTLGGGGSESDDETAMEFVSHIKLGWNLGNTLDAQSPGWAKTAPYEAETSWGNPVTSKAMIDAVKAAGFNTVRIPVSWGCKMDGSSYKINDDWMNRVQEIVDYVIDNDMYCIVNIHHDNSAKDAESGVPTSFPYFYPDSAHYQQSERFVTSIWSQVSERFKGYDNHLIFETLNEPRLIGHRNEWWIDSSNNDCKDSMDCINKLNAAALDSIRKSGGNNEKRFVLMPTYAANPDPATLAGCVMPNDDHILAEIHAYRPYNFCLANDGTQTSNFDANSDGSEIVSMMNNLKSKFLDHGIPVIIDEFGAMNRNNEDARAAWVKFYLETANSYGIPCVWWDNNAFSGSGENFGLLDRSTNQIRFPKIMSAMVEATKNRG
ncbi:MAG: cellulase family glycosylhydrolase [Oscillospiraceae bacterium]|nr:cellulase family glycosylhydrolase [Oscillospiraceae bacterium]